jgi:hypothetical protein
MIDRLCCTQLSQKSGLSVDTSHRFAIDLKLTAYRLSMEPDQWFAATTGRLGSRATTQWLRGDREQKM